jgi:hypothetical protein
MENSGDGSSKTAAPEGGAEGASESSVDDGGSPGTPGSAPKPPARPTGSILRGAALRRELVTRLPQLAVAGDSAGAMNVDPGAVDLDADAFVGPLQTLVSEGRS